MPTTFANTISLDGGVTNLPIYADRAEKDASGQDIQQTYATKTEVTTGLSSKEDSANKSQTLDPTSTTDFPSSAATASFVNSSVATATANFLGNFTLTDLGLTYPATDTQIGAALDSYAWPVGVTPTNNDYTYIEIENPQTTLDNRVERFKYNGSAWVYEYTLNNSSFTAAEKAAIDSGIDSAKVAIYDAHVANSDIHVTLSDKSNWNAKQPAISDLAAIRSGAQAGSTAVQPGDLATVATTGSYSSLTGTPTIPTATSDLTNDSGFITLSDVPAQVNADWNSSSGASEILNKPTIPSGVQLVPAATSADADKVLTVDGQGIPGWAVIPAQSTGLFQAEYGTTTYADIVQAINDKKIVYCRLSSGASRMAFLAYIGSSNVEFQYYRSLSSHSASNMTDEVYVYTVDSSGWSTTTRKTGVKVTAGTHMSQSYSNDTLTLNADWPDVDQTYDDTSSNAQSGIAVAQAIAGVNAVPASTSVDADKVLTVDAQGTPVWAGVSLGDVNNVLQVSALPATTDAHTLYLIPET